MPISLLSLDSTKAFESKHDSAKGTPEATKFYIRTLDSRVMGWLNDLGTTMKVSTEKGRVSEDVETSVAAHEVNFQIAKFGLEKVENIFDENGQPIEWQTKSQRLKGKSYTVVDDEFLARFPSRNINEIAGWVRQMNRMEDDEGN